MYFNPWVEPMNIITYEATAKLAETVDYYYRGLHKHAFSGKNGQLTMTNHTFENGIGTIEFDGDVTTIGKRAIYRCKGLTSVTIPNSVTSIDDDAFYECSDLTSVNIPDSVTNIGISAFEGCEGLTSVTIPNSVTSIGGGAFRFCSSLTSITSLATTAPTIQSYTFTLVKTNGTLTVPIGSTGYDVWMGTGDDYLGKYGWTKIEQ